MLGSELKFSVHGYASTLPRFHASTLHYLGFRGFRSAALLAACSLSIAACGSGGGESTDPARKSLLDQREKELASGEATVSKRKKEQDDRETALDKREGGLDERETALGNDKKDPTRKSNLDTREVALQTRETNLQNREQQQQQREQAAPAGFSGSDLSGDEIIKMANTINEIQAGQAIRFDSVKYAGQIIRTKIYPKEKAMFGRVAPSSTKVNGKGGYYLITFGEFRGVEYNSGNIHLLYRRDDLEEVILETLVIPSDLSLGLDDDFSYKVLKGEFDTNNDNTKDVKIHYEIASDYASDNTSDYLRWGFWTTAPIGAIISDYNNYNFSTYAKANVSFNASAKAKRFNRNSYISRLNARITY